MRLTADLPAKQAAADAARGRDRLAAVHALESQEEEIAELRESLPADMESSRKWLCEAVARYRVEHDQLVQAIADAAAAVEAAKEASKGDTWKWKARATGTGVAAEPKAVTAAREALTAAEKALAAREQADKKLLQMAADTMQCEAELAEINAWAARGYTDPRPACIVRQEEEFMAEMEAGCVALPLPKKRPYNHGRHGHTDCGASRGRTRGHRNRRVEALQRGGVSGFSGDARA